MKCLHEKGENMKVSLKDISKSTGFSPATVSNALNGKKGVNKNTVERVWNVARELGYFDESPINRIRLVIHKKNGLIIDDSPFFTHLLAGVEMECRKSGFEMMICNLDERRSDYKERLEEILNDRSVALLLLGTELSEENLEIYKGAVSPIVLLDSWSNAMHFNSVLINNADSAQNAVEYLIKKGHRKVGYLQGDFRIKAFKSRAVGYGRALDKHGITYQPEYVVTLSTTMDGAYKDMTKYLETHEIIPTAFFADNDMIALGAMKAIREKGYEIPEDVSIIGFDDLSSCEISTPRLTTLKVFKEEMGALAVRRLIEILQHDTGVKTKMQVCTAFIERDSVKDLNEIK